MCYSMGNAIRWLKLQVSKIDIDMPVSDAKKLLCDAIDVFISERITLAGLIIVMEAAESIQDGDVVVTYGYHALVERCLSQAREDGRQFKVVVVDNPDTLSGQEMAKKVSACGIPVTYMANKGGLDVIMKDATHFMLGAEAVFSNGAVYARSGTGSVAMLAEELGVVVVALCEGINFTDRMAINSITYNEIDPDTTDGYRLMFDASLPQYVEMIVTEFGITPPASALAIIRKLEEL